MKRPSFTAVGSVLEARALIAQGQTEPWAYSVKLECLGCTLELQTRDKAIFSKVAAGMSVEAVGRFEIYKGIPRLIAEDFKKAA